MPLRHFLFAAALVSAAPLHAATEFPGGLVPMDVVREFTGGTLYASLPDGFPPVSVPAGLDLRLLGSTSDTYGQKVVLRTALSREELFDALRPALLAQGWVDVSSTTSTIVYQLRVCHDEYGTLYISVNSANAGGNRVDVNRSTFPTSTTCLEQQAQAETNDAWSAFYTAHIPVLEVPPETVDTMLPPILHMGSSSSSGGRISITRDGNIEVPGTTAVELLAHFAQQMNEQGWTLDSSSEGERSASSVWIRSDTAPELATEPVEMLTTLTVLSGSDEVYTINLRFQSRPDAGGTTGFYDASFTD